MGLPTDAGSIPAASTISLILNNFFEDSADSTRGGTKNCTTLPRWLFKSRHGIYYFRAAIPLHLQATLKRKSIKKSLLTHDPSIAERQSILISNEYQKTLMMIDYLMRNLTTDNVNQAALEYFEFKMHQIDRSRVEPSQYKKQSLINDFQQIIDEFKSLAISTSADQSKDNRSYFSAVLNFLEISPNSDLVSLNQFKRHVDSIDILIKELVVCKVKGELQKVEDMLGTRHEKYKSMATTQYEPQNQIKQAAFLTVAEDYLKSLKITKGKNAPNDTSIDDYRKKLEHFSLLLNNKHFNQITTQDIIDCKNWTYNLPKNLRKINWQKAYTQEVEVIRDANHPFEKIAITTASKYFIQFGALLDFAYKNNYSSTNLLDLLDYTYTKTPQTQREFFTKEELNKIFKGYIYNDQPCEGLKIFSYQFWLPLLGAFTGARLNEICSLRLSDISFDKDHQCYLISINENGQDKKVKTHNSIRVVPIHQAIINAGFIEYNKLLSSQKHGRLFPELKFSTKSGYAKEASRWFSKFDKRPNGKYDLGYLGRVGVKTENTPPQSKNFHCFRHTFIENLKNTSGVELPKVADLVGHESNLSQTQQYGNKQLSVEIKLQTLNNLDYGIDLSHIKWSNFKAKVLKK